jgi:hypothetical protein
MEEPMRSAVLITVVLAALALAGSASAGCFATAGVAPPPATVGPGDTWKAQITVKQHGVRPIPDATPTLTITGDDGARKTFAAKPTGTVGVYAASVVFPTAGSWSYEVNDGFVNKKEGWDCSTDHTFAAVTIGAGGSSGPAPGDPSPSAAPEPAAAPADDGPPSILIVLLAAAAVSLLAAAGVALARRSGRRHARA